MFLDGFQKKTNKTYKVYMVFKGEGNIEQRSNEMTIKVQYKK